MRRLALAASLSLLILAGCGRGSQDLDVVLAESLASLELDGGTEIRRDEGGSGTTLGKPVRARLQRVFAPDSDSNLEELFEQVADAAQQDDWDLSEPTSTLFLGTKTVGASNLELAMGIDTGDLVVTIRLLG